MGVKQIALTGHWVKVKIFFIRILKAMKIKSILVSIVSSDRHEDRLESYLVELLTMGCRNALGTVIDKDYVFPINLSNSEGFLPHSLLILLSLQQ